MAGLVQLPHVLLSLLAATWTSNFSEGLQCFVCASSWTVKVFKKGCKGDCSPCADYRTSLQSINSVAMAVCSVVEQAERVQSPGGHACSCCAVLKPTLCGRACACMCVCVYWGLPRTEVVLMPLAGQPCPCHLVLNVWHMCISCYDLQVPEY